MPRVSQVGLVNKITPIGPGTLRPNTPYRVADEDSFASIQAQPTGANHTVILPGPTSSPGDLPSNGDWWGVADPKGVISGAHTLTVDGGGYPIQQAATFIITAPNSTFRFVFDDAAQAWFVFC